MLRAAMDSWQNIPIINTTDTDTTSSATSKASAKASSAGDMMLKLLPQNRNLVLIMGKGGTGKTSIARALHNSQSPSRWASYVPVNSPTKDTIVLDPHQNFKEYISFKMGPLGLSQLVDFFLEHRFVRFLESAAPGIKEIVTLGKLWYERTEFQTTFIDMPSSGHALAVLKAPLQFAKLFPAGPIHTDAVHMTNSLGDPNQCVMVITCLPEEMSLQETHELAQTILKFYPKQKIFILINRVLPESTPDSKNLSPKTLPIAIQQLFTFYQTKSQIQHVHLTNFCNKTTNPSLQILALITEGAL